MVTSKTLLRFFKNIAFNLFLGKQRTVEQLQCTVWTDMEAPKDTKTLLDLFDSSEETLLDSPGTILVHCSAGVGRTGTYIGLFKLIQDYQNKVTELESDV